MQEKIDLTVRFSPQVNRELGICAGMLGLSKSEFIRAACDAAMRSMPGALDAISSDMRARLDAATLADAAEYVPAGY